MAYWPFKGKIKEPQGSQVIKSSDWVIKMTKRKNRKTQLKNDD